MKRFYKNVTLEQVAEGFHLLLDGRIVKTPRGQALLLPRRALADAIAEEWRAQGEEIAPVTMPLLRLANTTLDGIANARGDVANAILRFGMHDLLCYRALEPPQLTRLQEKAWNPILDWASGDLGARLRPTAGLNPIDQPPDALNALSHIVSGLSDFELAGLHVIASVTGSLLLGLAVLRGTLSPSEAFRLSRIDEDFQAGKWGQDAEAQARARRLAREVDVAATFVRLAQG